jgi:hypothetical protein
VSVIRKLRAIVSAYKNYAFPNEEIEQMAIGRAKICAKCDHANPDHPFKLLLDDNRTKDIKGLGCDICHCPISAKIRQIYTGCPEKKW